MTHPILRILVLTKRQYTNKDLLDDRFGRLREIPLALAKRGHVVQGLCLSYVNLEEGWVQDGPVWWKSVNATSLKFPGLLRFVRDASLLAQTSDVIWACSDSFYGVIAYFLSRKTGVPVVFDLYDNFDYFLAAKLPIVKQLYRHAIRHCDAVTCVSRPLAGLIKGQGRSDGLHVLENAVRDDIFKPIDQSSCRSKLNLPLGARIVGTAGALDESHGIRILFDAFGRISRKFPDLHLVLAGRRQPTLRIPSDSRVHYLGELPLETIPLFLNALDVATVCNLDNNFGRYCFPQKAREIMACNIPMIAANVGSMKFLLHKHPEWLYEPHDSEDLAHTLERRLTDKSTAYEGILSWDEISVLMGDILSEVVRQRANPPAKR
jgi:glycosyltransferase involved in cell wall biosynthesis